MKHHNHNRILNDVQTESFMKYFRKNTALYIMIIPGLLCLILFRYLPMYGLVVAFQNFRPVEGFFGSEWVGLKHFMNFFRDPFCWRIIRNTFILGIYSIIYGFPAPIILALLLNELHYVRFKKIAQTISYMPYFLSVVIVVGIMKDLFSATNGIVNTFLTNTGIIEESIKFFTDPAWFRPLYIGSGIWQGIGFGSIIYLGAMAGINVELYESAVIDGANRIKQIWHITIPSILPTIIILFIFSIGGILGNDFQKILLIYNPRTYSTSDVISTYVYRMGIEGSSFSYSSAVGLLSTVISLFFLIGANYLSKKASDTSLF